MFTIDRRSDNMKIPIYQVDAIGQIGWVKGNYMPGRFQKGVASYFANTEGIVLVSPGKRFSILKV
jgi:hypothetical protein